MPRQFAMIGLAAALFGSAALAAEESDVVGLWSVDTEALRGQMESMLARSFADLPESQRVPAMAMARARLDPVVGQMAGEAEFRPDGTVVFTSATDPESHGTWSLEDDQLRFQRDQPMPQEPAYIGTVEGDVISVRPVGSNSNPHFTLTLRRNP